MLGHEKGWGSSSTSVGKAFKFSSSVEVVVFQRWNFKDEFQGSPAGYWDQFLVKAEIYILKNIY